MVDAYKRYRLNDLYGISYGNGFASGVYMWLEKILFGGLGGGVLGIVVAIVSLFQGKSFADAGQSLMSCMVLGIIVVFWATRNQDSDDHGGSADRDISELHRSLQIYHRAVADCNSKGDHSGAAYYRSQISVVESQLRSLGA